MLHFILKKNKQKESVDVTFYDLVELPTLLEFTNLLDLNCSDNKLKLLPELPSTLRKSAFEMLKGVKELPSLPNGLRYLNCRVNKLSKLPDTLTYLFCNDNQLDALPKLPKLRALCCQNNQITILPNLYYDNMVLCCSCNPLIYKNFTYE